MLAISSNTTVPVTVLSSDATIPVLANIITYYVLAYIIVIRTITSY